MSILFLGLPQQRESFVWGHFKYLCVCVCVCVCACVCTLLVILSVCHVQESMMHKKYDIFYNLTACCRNLADQAGLANALEWAKIWNESFKTRICLDCCYTFSIIYTFI